jgi:glycosyltransferase involved in cell wall biosynthesis
MSGKAPISVIILTYQEEANLGTCLANVADWASEVFIVDSYSTDGTAAIAQNQGVPVWQNPFENFAQQRNWALDHLPLTNPWVLFLDADELVSEELKAEITKILPNLGADLGGLYTKRRFIWMGRWLKRGGMYKQVLRIVRRDGARVAMAGWREYMQVKGRTLLLKNDLIHQDHKGVGDWILKHDRYASQEADELMASYAGRSLTEHWHAPDDPGRVVTENERIVKLRNFWNRLPLLWRPPLSFFIKYCLMLGFLDGIPGAIYYFLHDFWYPLLVDVKFMERRGKPVHSNLIKEAE